jgi:hypothetical protein
MSKSDKIHAETHQQKEFDTAGPTHALPQISRSYIKREYEMSSVSPMREDQMTVSPVMSFQYTPADVDLYKERQEKNSTMPREYPASKNESPINASQINSEFGTLTAADIPTSRRR